MTWPKAVRCVGARNREDADVEIDTAHHHVLRDSVHVRGELVGDPFHMGVDQQIENIP